MTGDLPERPNGAGVLAGVRVVDFGRFVAGPCCAAILGDLGADVIRIEKRDGGEDRWLGPVASGGEGAMFLQNNRNKRCLTLDPKLPSGREVLHRLIATADVFVANLPERQLEDLGLSYESLREIRPDIIVTNPSAFGSDGPYRHRLGFDAVGQVMSGAVSRSGWPDQPVRAVVPYVDFATALASVIGTLAALMERKSSGRGQRIETSLMATALMVTSAMLIEQDEIQPNRVATLNRGQLSAPNNIYSTRDGWIMAQVVGQPLFERWLALVGREEWRDDPRFADDTARGEHWDVLDRCMAEWCAARTRSEALDALERARVPGYPVNTVQQALEDPQVAAMHYLRRVDYPGLPHPAPLVETPFRMSAGGCAFRRRPPMLGEHTDEILRELGYDDRAIHALREQGAV